MRPVRCASQSQMSKFNASTKRAAPSESVKQAERLTLTNALAGPERGYGMLLARVWHHATTHIG
jgi:hypothetical protein